jgi:hypothetical protein
MNIYRRKQDVINKLPPFWERPFLALSCPNSKEDSFEREGDIRFKGHFIRMTENL